MEAHFRDTSALRVLLVLEVWFLAGTQYFLLSDILLFTKLLILMFPKKTKLTKTNF